MDFELIFIDENNKEHKLNPINEKVNEKYTLGYEQVTHTGGSAD